MIGRRELLAGAGGIALASAFPFNTAAADDGPVATTNYGKVRGASNDGINVFKGIPYGASTAGANRFRPPQPPQPWQGVRDALEYPPMSPQTVYTTIGPLFTSWNFFTNTSEDCLGLNVFTPALRDGAKRPVMVWFHGGDYGILSGATDPTDGTRLCRKGDVVLVTINHRLNVFGFLYLADVIPELGYSANVGMLDLVAALMWVRDNIAEFGGDPGNVTIFGQSGGGGKVSTIMAMPAAAGLFHKAIVQSGSYARNAHLEAMNTETASQRARNYLNILGVEPPDAGRKLLDMPADALIAGLRKITPSPIRPWRPVADGKTLPKGPWWPDGPAVSANVPLMIGTNETEMTMLLGSFDPSAFELDDAAMRTRLGQLFAAGDVDTVVNAFKATRPNATPGELYFAITTANSFRRGAWLQADAKAAQNAAPVYLYELDWHTPVGGGKWMSPHSLELPLVFDNVAKGESMVGNGPDAQKLADQMSAAWIAFARTGNPSTSANPNWPPYKPPQRATMVFDVQSKVVNAFRDDERIALSKITAHGPFD